MSLTVDNQTEWDGRHLRSLVRTVIKQCGMSVNRRVTVKTSGVAGKENRWFLTDGQDAGLYRGYAYYNSRRSQVTVPKIERKVRGEWLRHDFMSKAFARVLEHELAHNRGMRHGEMTDDLRYCRQDIDYDLPTVEPKPSFESRVE